MARRESALRFPLTRLFGSIAHVKVLRELVQHGGELSASALCVRTHLSTRAVHLSLRALEDMSVIRSLGSGRSRLYRRRRSHPFSQILLDVFREEEKRFAAILGAAREAIEHCRPRPLAGWIYGSVARGEDRPTSDLDVAVITAPGDAPAVEHQIREALHDAEEKLVFRASVVALAENDVVRLASRNDPLWLDLKTDAIAILGDPPEILLQRLTRAHRQTART